MIHNNLFGSLEVLWPYHLLDRGGRGGAGTELGAVSETILLLEGSLGGLGGRIGGAGSSPNEKDCCLAGSKLWDVLR